MKSLIDLYTNGLLSTFGWTLIHFLWQGLAAAALLWCALALLRDQSGRLRYTACCATLLLMAACPIATFIHLANTQRPLTSTPIVLNAASFSPTVINIPVDPTPQPLSTRIAHVLDTAAPWLPALWIVGALLFLLRLNLGVLAARRMERLATTPVPDNLQLLFLTIADRLGIAHTARLLQSSLVQVPTVIGWLRPVVLLPASCFTGLSQTQIEALLAHELAHILRRDYLVSVLQSIIESLLFYHPAVWWVSRQVRRERECCCDEVAATLCGDRLAYAKALSLLEEQRLFQPTLALGANGGVLAMRIKRLLGCDEVSPASRTIAITALTLLIAFGGLTVARAARRSLTKPIAQVQSVGLAMVSLPETASTPSNAGVLPVAEQRAQPTHPVKMNAQIVAQKTDPMALVLQRALFAGVPQSSPDPQMALVYKNWLSQDVLWIITPEERSDFLKLNNDQERDTFIEQFWQHHAAAGETRAEAREHHYARIAFSNMHFGKGTEFPGWKSDRGHIYIAYGKPESIDSHPSGANGGSPFEVWHYRTLPGIGENVDIEFVDLCSCGEYHLTIDGTKTGSAAANSQPSTDRAAQAAAILAAPQTNARSAPPRIREINFKGLRSITTSDVTTRFLVANVQLALEIPYDPAELAKAVAAMNQMLYERGERNFSVKPIINKLPHNTVSIEFDVQEGPRVVGVSMQQPRGDAPSASAASANSGALTVIVIDPHGAVLPRATVRLTSPRTNFIQAGQSDDVGSYAASLPAGTYNVEIFIPGFQRWQQPVAVSANQPAHLDARLSVGAAAQYVTVNSSASAQGANTAAPVDAGPARVSADTMRTHLLSSPSPVYPSDAKAAHVQGTVVLHVIISKQGMIEEIQAVGGPEMLKGSALDAVSQWTYRPYLQNGVPVQVATTVNVNYTFGGEGPLPVPSIPSGSMPVRVSGGVIAGLATSMRQPIYPPEAKAARVQGSVVLHALISKEGEIENLDVVSGPELLKGSALDAVSHWTYKPYLLDGEPVEVETTITVNFTYGGG